MSHILVIPCCGDSSLTTQPSLLASSWSVKTKVDSRLCSGLYIHTDVAHMHTQNNLASGLVILPDCCSDPIFSLVPITTVIILIYMYDGEPDFLSKVSCVMSTSFMKAGWPLLETCH